MSWKKGSRTKFSDQDVAEQVLQLYLKSLQDHKNLTSILSECCVLDYFGKVFYGGEKVSAQLISNLLGSNFELSSLSTNDQLSTIPYSPVNIPEEKIDDDLGVTLISPPRVIFPSVTFTTPVRSYSQMSKRSASEVFTESNSKQSKGVKKESDNTQSSSKKKLDAEKDTLLSPQSIQTMIHKDVKYLTAYGTIRYPKRSLSTMDIKRIKHHSLISLRGRFCQLYIGFETDDYTRTVFQCKIRTIKYSYSSKVTPRNLLKAFNEVDES